MQKSGPIRILQVLKLNVNSGVSSIVMNLCRHMDSQEIQFDFATWGIEEDANYIEEAKKFGGQVYIFPNYKKNFKEFNHKIIDILLKNEYFGIHCHEYLVSIPFLYWARRAGISFRIAHSHNPTIDSWWKRQFTVLCRPFFKRLATDFFACSEESGDFLFGRNVKKNIISNGIDSIQYKFQADIRDSARTELQLNDKFVVGAVGRLEMQKNPFFLLKIFREIYRREPDAILLWVGDGSLKKEICKKIKEYGLENKVIFLGIRQDVSNLMQAMDLLLFPSCYEGFGIVAVEAQAADLPCLISDRIPNQVIVIKDRAEVVKLEDSPSVWAEKALAMRSIKRRDVASEICSAGYDIVTEALKLQNYYLHKFEEIN